MFSNKLTLGDFITGEDFKTRLSKMLGVGTTNTGYTSHEQWWNASRCQTRDANGNLVIDPSIVIVSLNEGNEFRLNDAEAKHYFTRKELYNLRHLKGWVVDVNEMRVVCYSQGYASTVASHIMPTGIVTDNIGTVLDFSKCREVYPGIDGVPIRVFLYKGVVYVVSHTSLYLGNSRVEPKAPSFLELYQRDGPSNEDLFGNDWQRKSSCCVYYFLVSHESLMMASQLDPVSQLVYIRCNYMPAYPGYDTVDHFATSEYERFSYPDLTIEGANMLLGDGTAWHSNHESVMAILDVDIGVGVFVETHVRVAHPIYLWRKKVLNDDTNIEHRALEIYDMCIPKIPYNGIVDWKSNTYSLFPYNGTPTVAEFKNIENPDADRFTIAPLEKLNDFNITPENDYRDLRFRNALCSLYIAAPTDNKKKQVRDIYEKFLMMRSNVTAHIIANLQYYISSFYNNNNRISSQNLSKVDVFSKQPWNKNGRPTKAAERIFDIVCRAYEAASKSNTNNTAKIVEFNIKNEYGSSIYTMYKTINNTYFQNK